MPLFTSMTSLPFLLLLLILLLLSLTLFLLSPPGKRMQRAYVRTDGGLRGSISVYDIVDEMIDVDIFNLADYLQVRQTEMSTTR